MTITIERMDGEKSPEKPTKKPEASAHGAQRAMTDAERFAGNPMVLHARLNRAMDELYYYRASRRHHTAAETSEVRGHKDWVSQAEGLCLALRDAIRQGLLEPEKPKEDA